MLHLEKTCAARCGLRVSPSSRHSSRASPSSAGKPRRQRYNVLGAFNATTHQLIRVTNDTYITATTVCELLHKIAALGLGTPVTLFLDNARYQHCQLVQNLARTLGIELLFLPSYSPNLNLIERLWKFVKKEVLNSRHQGSFAEFRQVIDGCLDQLPTTHRDAINTLMTPRFQLLKMCQCSPREE